VQVPDDAAACAHAAPGDDEHRAGDVAQARRVAAAADGVEVVEVERGVAARDAIERKGSTSRRACCKRKPSARTMRAMASVAAVPSTGPDHPRRHSSGRLPT